MTFMRFSFLATVMAAIFVTLIMVIQFAISKPVNWYELAWAWLAIGWAVLWYVEARERG